MTSFEKINRSRMQKEEGGEERIEKKTFLFSALLYFVNKMRFSIKTMK